jgi:segregation and condensation protein B
MNEFYIRNVIEAALLAAGKSLQLAEIGQLFDETRRPKVEDIRAALDGLAAEYAPRGIEVKETAAGFRIQVRREFASEISRLWPERPARYSRALLETLALIAYRQPITRAEIEAVRGVAVNPNIVKTVIERNWVRVVGHRDVPGRPELLGTTREFLDYFGLRSLDELPPLAELKAMGDYNLQLELPNGVAADGGEAKAEGEGAAPVALLTSDAAANTDDVAADAVVDASVAGEAAQDVTADTESVFDAVSRPEMSDADQGDEAAHDSDADAGDAVAHGEVGDGDLGGEAAHDAGTSSDTAHHDADAHLDAEAERTLAAGEVAKHTAADSDESDATTTTTSNESSEASDDSADDDADDDELSADGHDSRELVAAPRDFDD